MWNRVGERLQHLADRAVRAGARHPVCLCCLAGFLAGALLDIDHVPSVLFGIRTGFVPFAVVPQIGEGRNLHGLALAVGGLGCSCAGGYLALMVLSDWLPEVRRSWAGIAAGFALKVRVLRELAGTRSERAGHKLTARGRPDPESP